MVEAEVKCSLTHQGIPIIFWKQIEGAFSRACEMFFSSEHFDLLARQSYCSSMVCATKIGYWLRGPSCVYKPQGTVTQLFL